MLRMERAVKISHPQGGGFTSFAAAKVRLFHKLTKLSATFFKKSTFFTPYTLYIIYKRKNLRHKIEVYSINFGWNLFFVFWKKCIFASKLK